ncbi:MAG TPA: dihydropteroate synthase [Nitrospiria bacterium]|nr:dihydropteroate synthase [Nitrospiria bacterium]
MKTREFNPARSNRVLLMGILNVTPDSFSDGGDFLRPEDALRRAEEMVRLGADILDVGGESSRPGAEPVPSEEESLRVVPVIEQISSKLDIPVSIDTTKADVARRALDAGAVMVNDISALRFDPEMAPLVARTGAAVALMHMKGSPRDMQKDPVYDDVLGEIGAFFRERAAFAEKNGIAPEKIILDPGIGFGKSVEHNLQILSNLEVFKELGYPLLVGPSRKSFIGRVLDLPVDERLEGTAAAAAVSVMKGAAILRVHDIKPMKRVVRLAEAMQRHQHA